MSDEVELGQRAVDRAGPGSFSVWSIVALILFGLAILAITFAVYVALHSPGTGPAEGAATLFLVATCCIAAWCFTLLGAVFGWIGVRRSSGAPRVALAIAAINCTLCGLPAIAAILWLILALLAFIGESLGLVR
jgi:hypothetical protein